MIGHRTYTDAPRLISTRAVKPPLARGHRKWLNIAKVDRNAERQDREAGRGPKDESAVPKGFAQPSQPPSGSNQ